MTLDVRVEPYDGPTAQGLIAAVQAEYVQRYGGPDQAPVDPAEFAPPAGTFLIGYDGHDPVAMGGLRRHDETTVEIKRMYVVPQRRGRGYSRLLLAALEQAARQLGAERVVLETGLRQPEAMSLYESSGYEPIEGFGYYCGAELSRSYAKSLGTDQAPVSQAPRG